MGIEYTDSGLRSLFQDIDDNKITLPNFQRGFVWGAEKQKRLASSWIVGLPIGSTLLLEGNANDFAAREICKNKSVTPHDDCKYVLDGQQRLSSLRSVFYDLYKDTPVNEANNNLFAALQKRWFLRIVPNEYEIDIFGWKKLNFESLKSREPSDVIDFISWKKILKTVDTDKWYHPSYSPRDANGKALAKGRASLDVARHALEERMVPLYEIALGSNGIHRYVLREFAKYRCAELKQDVADGTLSVKQVLQHVNPEIDEHSDSDELDLAWATLQTEWIKDISDYLHSLVDQKVPIILVPKDEIDRAVAIYEEINEGGTRLSIFDLIVAKAAKGAHSFDSLPGRIIDQLEQDLSLPAHFNLIGSSAWSPKYMEIIGDKTPEKTFQDFYLNALSIIVHLDEKKEPPAVDHIKKEKILRLAHEDINKITPKAVTALSRALAFLQCKCGIIHAGQLHYKLMIQPMAYALIDDQIWNDESAIKKLEAWYWVSLFGGTYRERQNDQCITDVENIKAWLKGGGQPHSSWTSAFKRVLNYQGYSDYNTLIMEENDGNIPPVISAGIWQYVLSNTPPDFLLSGSKLLSAGSFATAKNDQDSEMNLHHVIPLASSSTIETSAKSIRSDNRHILNSPLNITPISRKANSDIGALSVDRYTRELKSIDLLAHSLPSAEKFEKDTSESELDYYKRLLKARFDSLSSELKKEIRKNAPDLTRAC